MEVADEKGGPRSYCAVMMSFATAVKHSARERRRPRVEMPMQRMSGIGHGP